MDFDGFVLVTLSRHGDPAVSSGRLTAGFQTWHVPAGMMISGPGKPPASLAEARS